MSTQNQVAPKQATPVDRLKTMLNSTSVKEQFQNALKENSGLFVASLIDIYSNDRSLQDCEPKAVVMEALKAATLKLPINKSLGFAYIVPFKNKGKSEPTMIIGYKGLIQLAMRTGSYRYINADVVYEGELETVDKLTGEISISGTKTSDKPVGYFAFFETLNGFRKTVFWHADKVREHGKKYSKSFNSSYSPWQSQFDDMAIKTVLRNAISKWGIMSVEMQNAIANDIDADSAQEINPNSEVIDVDFTEEPATTSEPADGFGTVNDFPGEPPTDGPGF